VITDATSPNLWKPSARQDELRSAAPSGSEDDDGPSWSSRVRDAAAHRIPAAPMTATRLVLFSVDELHAGREDAAELVLADHPPRHDHRTCRVPTQIACAMTSDWVG